MKKINLLAVLAAVIVSSCSGDDDSVDRSNVTLQSITQLKTLPQNSEYEVWLVSGGENISLGRYRELSNGQTFAALTGDVNSATGFKISIEPGNDPDRNAISNTVILSGTFNGNSADLSIEGSLGSFANASGVFTLWTPTDNNVNNDQNGVWFLKPNNGNPQAGLNLPTLPEGWKYEGWAVVKNSSNQDVFLSTGRFSSPSGKDGSAAFSSTDKEAPLFPGEDFINMNILSREGFGFTIAPDLRLKRVFISVEPEPDNDYAEPFVIQPLINNQSGNILYPATQTMDLNTLSFPRGVVSK